MNNEKLDSLEVRAQNLAADRLEKRLTRLESRHWVLFPVLRAMLILRKVRRLRG